ncbi:hypothetical protein Q5P01_025567 [Channa striata]|uniref:Ig-like domain-containing protein n=1 Tax=Channa striata TaxID=64152 RepID=A0AA88IPT3_CHASR|nr:hypothetical protein Q5P01_025567 [Channa striata]
MLLAEAGCFFVGVMLYTSGVKGGASSVCALKGSSVKLSCPETYRTSSDDWFTVHKEGRVVILRQLFVDGARTLHTTSEGGHFTLTISDLRETDENIYCCTDSPSVCERNGIRLSVSELQVKVIPATEDQTVNLMCSTSCALSEKPAAYIWYRNREFLYEDWSPWYQELVSSEEGVTYSCAIKGHEHLRAPDVSVDSVTPNCFSVTYTEGTMCSHQLPCSITHPTKTSVESTSPGTLTCVSSCPMTEPQAAYEWYHNRYRDTKTQQFSVSGSHDESFSCAKKDFEHLLSPEACTGDNSCWSVNYENRRICAPQGSSVNISSTYSHPHNKHPVSKLWYKIQSSGGEETAVKVVNAAGRVKYFDNTNRHRHILEIKYLQKNDSALYTFKVQRKDGKWKESDFPGVTVVATGVRVRFTPAVVAEGQRATVTCSTSCPLPGDTAYIWHLNGQLLSQSRSKHLVLDPVSSRHAGNYSCAIRNDGKNTSSREKALTVLSSTMTEPATPSAAAAGAAAALLLLLFLFVLWWIR